MGIVRRSGPVAVVLASFVFLAGSFFMSGFVPALTATAAALAGVALLVGPVPAGAQRFSWWRLLPAALAVLSVGWSNWLLASPRSVEDAVVSGLRVGFFVLPGSVLAGFVDPFVLGDQLGGRLRFPGRPVIALVVALDRVDGFADDWDDLVRTRRIRGLASDGRLLGKLRDYAATTLHLLVGAIRQASETTVALQARGYSAPLVTGRRRTWSESSPWTGADTVLVVSCVVLAALPGVLARLL